MTFVKKSKAQSCLHAAHDRQSRLSFQKYVVIDSENEDEVINLKHYDSQQHMRRVLLTEEKSSVIVKSKGSTITNFMSNVTEPERKADNEIRSAEIQVKSLQKECELLEQMINELIEEQSKLAVILRKRQRAQSMSRQSYENKKAEVQSCQTSFTEQHSKENIEIIKADMASIVVRDPISFVTPLFSKNIERPHKKSLQIIKTVEIKTSIKPKKGQENEPSKKLSFKKKKSVSKVKQMNKNKTGCCKHGVKLY